jgi:hypothetical protein
MIHTIACLNSKIELFKSNVLCDSCVGMLAKNEKLKLDYSTYVQQHEIASAEIIEINSMHSGTCSSTLNNDTCVDSNNNHDVLLDINVSNMSTISCTSCNDLKYDLADACHENNLFKAKLDGSHIDVSLIKSLHNDMSDKECAFCLVVMEDLAKLQNVYAQVASQLESTICELDELKARPSFQGACLKCAKLKLELDVRSLNVKKLETELPEKSHILVTSSPYEVCVSLKSKLVHAINENTMLAQDVAYLTLRFERTKLSEKSIEEDLSQVDECVTRSIHKLCSGYERCEPKGEISTKFVLRSTYKDEKETLKAKPIPYPSNPKSSFNPKRVQRQTTSSSMPNLDGVYTCMCLWPCGSLG